MNLKKDRAHIAARKYLAIVDFCHTLEKFNILKGIETIEIGENAYRTLCPF